MGMRVPYAGWLCSICDVAWSQLSGIHCWNCGSCDSLRGVALYKEGRPVEEYSSYDGDYDEIIQELSEAHLVY